MKKLAVIVIGAFFATVAEFSMRIAVWAMEYYDR